MKKKATLLPALPLAFALTLAPAGGTLSIAQVQPAPEQAEPTDAQPAETSEEARQRAKEERIAEYLRKKEERRAKREQTRAAREKAAANPAPDRTTPKPPPVHSYDLPLNENLPRTLAEAQRNVRRTLLGQDPTVQTYLDMVDVQAASPQQLAALGNFLAEAGMTAEALEYYLTAVALDDTDAIILGNLGTLYRQLGKHNAAMRAYRAALSLDPNNAPVHYNLGATLDDLNKYEEAIAEYKRALSLDPSLADPRVNPQAANNQSLIAVQLMLYRERAGSLGLPMVDVPGGGIGGDNGNSGN